MRVLVTIPHFCRRDPAAAAAGPYGSETGDRAARRDQVAACLSALAQTFGPRQALMGGGVHAFANTAYALQMDVVLVTTGDQHLAAELPASLFHHLSTGAEPRCLGFVCHTLMREHAEQYDWFVFLEDDIAVADPLFLDKLRWFNARFGEGAVLQPNRFELSPEPPILKLYIDGNTVRPDIPARYQDITVDPLLHAEAFGRQVAFRRVENAHSGCFFVSAAQLGRLLASRSFGVPTAEFFGPLESAATLPLLRDFKVYKPSLSNAGFLEIQHMGRRFINPGAPVPAGDAS